MYETYLSCSVRDDESFFDRDGKEMEGEEERRRLRNFYLKMSGWLWLLGSFRIIVDQYVNWIIIRFVVRRSMLVIDGVHETKIYPFSDVEIYLRVFVWSFCTQEKCDG